MSESRRTREVGCLLVCRNIGRGGMFSSAWFYLCSLCEVRYEPVMKDEWLTCHCLANRATSEVDEGHAGYSHLSLPHPGRSPILLKDYPRPVLGFATVYPFISFLSVWLTRYFMVTAWNCWQSFRMLL